MKEVLLQRAARNVLTSFVPIEEGSGLRIFYDDGRSWLASAFQHVGEDLSVPVIPTNLTQQGDVGGLRSVLTCAEPVDVIISTFSWAFLSGFPWRSLFPPFVSPPGFSGRSAHIRPRIPAEPLLRMLCDDLHSIRRRAVSAMDLSRHGWLRVLSSAGTDLVFSTGAFHQIPFEANPHAFLPAAEVYTSLSPGSAQGKVVVDLTVGEFVYEGDLWDPLGAVDCPVQLTVRNGRIIGVDGGDIARRLAKLLDDCPPSCAEVVELGIGLSAGEQTGHIGADECLAGTCHFGIGDAVFYGGDNRAPIHLDVVVDAPSIEPFHPG